MDILDYILQITTEVIGPESVTPEKRAVINTIVRLEKGKDRHYLYSAAALRHQQRTEQIFECLRSGLSTREIAERIGVSHRRVNQIVSTVPMTGSRMP